MVQTNMPTRRQSQSSNSNERQLFMLGGALAGGAVGGPAGALTGASLGNQAQDLVGSKEIQQPEIEAVPTAMSRRKADLDQTPLRQIRDSIDSLKYVKDDATRMELAKPLLQADYMARQQG